MDARVEHRECREPGRRLCRRPHRRRRRARRRGRVAGQGARRGQRGARDAARLRAGRNAVRPPVRLGGLRRRRGRASGAARGLRDRRRRFGCRARGAGVRCRGLRAVQGERAADRQPGHRGRALRVGAAGRRVDVLQGRRQAARRRPARARPAVPARPVHAQLPALLALPHAADVLRAAVLVRPHHRDQGPAARREREDELVPRAHQARPLRRLAEQQHRLGALARPLLGHPAAGMAQRRRPVPPGVRRVAGRAARAVRRRAGGPASSLRGRRDVHAAGRGRDLSPRATGDRRVVRLGLDAVRAVRRAVPQPRTRRGVLPRRLHLRGDRPDARMVLLAHGGRDARLRRELVPHRARPRPHPRRGRPQDEQAPRQHPRTDRR